MPKKKKALVFGASGLVGSAVAKHLLCDGCDVIAVSRTPPGFTR